MRLKPKKIFLLDLHAQPFAIMNKTIRYQINGTMIDIGTHQEYVMAKELVKHLNKYTDNIWRIKQDNQILSY